MLLSVPLVLTFISRIGHPRDRNIIFVNLGEGLALLLGGVTCLAVAFMPSLRSLSLYPLDDFLSHCCLSPSSSSFPYLPFSFCRNDRPSFPFPLAISDTDNLKLRPYFSRLGDRRMDCHDGVDKNTNF